MRVLHILNELKPSGAEIMLLAAAPIWDAKGLESHILSTGKAQGEYADTLAEAGYRIHHLPFRGNVSFLWKFVKIVRSFDVVHIHTERANFWYALIARLVGVRKIIRTIHGVFSFRRWLRWKRCIQRWGLKYMGIQQVTIGPSVNKQERNHFRNPTLCIPNWYNPRIHPANEKERYQARQGLGIHNDKFVVVSIGNCCDLKNHPMLLQALAEISKDMPFVYLHVGIEQKDRPEFQLAKTLEISDCVRFVGFVRDVLPFLHAADAYVMPSQHEGFSIAAIEAMAAGVPVIFSDVPGLRDLRNVSKDVLWVELTSESIAEALRQLIQMPPSKRIEIGKKLSSAVNARFSAQKGALAYLRLYQSCLD